jgi:methyl-accepting chemotaxis protein
VALHRIVLTTPWKLGLFVFMLVIGCGFGLIYGYVSLFGVAIDLQDEQAVKSFFAMCGGVALLAVLGYLGVVTQARPLDKVMRGGQKRSRIMRRFGAIEDPREVDLSDFEAEPDLVAVLERWIQDVGAANNAQMAIVNQREALTNLAMRVQSAGHSPEGLVASDDETQPLVNAINELIQEARHQPEEPTGTVDENVTQAWHQGITNLQQQQAQLLGFASSVAASSEELSRRAQTNLASTGDHELGAALRDSCAKNTERITELRTTLETLAEEANRLAINAALQVSRLGESGSDLVAVTEEVRSLSTRYQRLASDLRVCENDQQAALGQIDDLVRQSSAGDESQTSAGLSSASIQKVAMVLDQNAGGLKEIASELGAQLTELRQAMGDTSETVSPQAESGSAPVAFESGPAAAMSDEVAPLQLETSMGAPMDASPPAPAAAAGDPAMMSAGPSANSGSVAPAAEQADEVHDLSEFGAVELPLLSDEQGKPIYDLRELGAVEL